MFDYFTGVDPKTHNVVYNSKLLGHYRSQNIDSHMVYV